MCLVFHNDNNVVSRWSSGRSGRDPGGSCLRFSMHLQLIGLASLEVALACDRSSWHCLCLDYELQQMPLVLLKHPGTVILLMKTFFWFWCLKILLPSNGHMECLEKMTFQQSIKYLSCARRKYFSSQPLQLNAQLFNQLLSLGLVMEFKATKFLDIHWAKSPLQSLRCLLITGTLSSSADGHPTMDIPGTFLNAGVT